MTGHSPTEPLADPGIATAEDGHVILEGPGGVAVTMTAEAAIATGQSLIEAGEQARKLAERE
ncbi:hypothetical protein [Sphingobium baderi]|uniref:Uncharacterized protein n=1 Tax=Sphingobium baderi TaxID=1332080 RepID=A0A0S3EZW4_9SPHN|nr:hypothetical protein [Sphingobium baderi]ALR20975.1 hypothetical protein ATN00_12355 [Sphingobium baderi]